MIGQSVFFTNGPSQVSGDSVSVNSGNLGSLAQPYTNLYLAGSIFSESGVFKSLTPTGMFFPPLLTNTQRTGLFSGYASPLSSVYDGLTVFQISPNQQLMIVQSGMWKTVQLS